MSTQEANIVNKGQNSGKILNTSKGVKEHSVLENCSLPIVICYLRLIIFATRKIKEIELKVVRTREGRRLTLGKIIFFRYKGIITKFTVRLKYIFRKNQN